jgi:hypothetical protein
VLPGCATQSRKHYTEPLRIIATVQMSFDAQNARRGDRTIRFILFTLGVPNTRRTTLAGIVSKGCGDSTRAAERAQPPQLGTDQISPKPKRLRVLACEIVTALVRDFKLTSLQASGWNSSSRSSQPHLVSPSFCPTLMAPDSWLRPTRRPPAPFGLQLLRLRSSVDGSDARPYAGRASATHRLHCSL